MSTQTEIKTAVTRTQGQILLVVARWVLVLAGLVLVLWNPGDLDDMRIKILFLFLLAGGNFYLGTQVLRRQRMTEPIIYAASLADIVVISLILITEGGFKSNSYIFYYPAILAISVVFPTLGMALFTGGAITAYTFISLLSMTYSPGNFQILLTRLLMILAVGVIGSLFRQMENKRRTKISVEQETAEDIFFGQIAIIWARWFFICAAAILVLWTAETTGELTVGVFIIGALMSINFFIHGRYQMEKPANQILIMATTMIDLFLITFVVLFWGPGGLQSSFFIFYYPLFFAFALVFPPRITIGYTILALGCYAAASFISGPEILTQSADFELFVMRVITLAAMSGLGTYYYRIQRNRRRVLAQKEARNNSIPRKISQMAAQPKS